MAQGASEDIRVEIKPWKSPKHYYINGSMTLKAIRQAGGGYGLFDTANEGRAIFERGQEYDWIYGRYRWSEHATPVVVVRSDGVFGLVDAETGEEIVFPYGSEMDINTLLRWLQSYRDEKPFAWKDGDVSGTLTKIPVRVDYPSGLSGELNVAFHYYSDSYERSEPIPDDMWSKAVFCDREGNTVPKEALPFDSVSSFSDGVAVVWKDGKCGVIDTSVKFVLPYEYDSIHRDRDGYLRLCKSPIINPRWRQPVEVTEDRVGIATTRGDVVVPCEYSDVSVSGYRMVDKPVFIVRKTAKGGTPLCGLLDSRGGEILPVKYADIDIDHHTGVCVVQDSASGRFGTVDFTDGRPVIPAVYDEISIVHSPGSGVVCFVRKGRKWGCLDSAGKSLLPSIYDSVEMHYKAGDGSMLVQFRGEWLRVDRRNRLIERYEKRPEVSEVLEELTYDMLDL